MARKRGAQISRKEANPFMSAQPKRLGRGLSSLISTEIQRDNILPSPVGMEAQPDQAAANKVPEPTARPGPQLQMVPVESIRTNPSQPRKVFDEAAIEGLARSLKDRGALQPIVVRRSGAGFELVAGERRLRAARKAGLKEMPAVIRAVGDTEMLELALIENIQRADLGAVERARAYKALADRNGLTHEQIAEKMGEDRVTVTNYLRLLSLAPAVLERIEDNSLNMGHARALLGLSDARKQVELAERAVKDGWSVRRVEAEVRRLTEAAKQGSGKAPEAVRPAAADAARRLTEALGTRVEVREGRRRHTGRLVIEYYSLDDFERITQRLGLSSEPA